MQGGPVWGEIAFCNFPAHQRETLLYGHALIIKMANALALAHYSPQILFSVHSWQGFVSCCPNITLHKRAPKLTGKDIWSDMGNKVNLSILYLIFSIKLNLNLYNWNMIQCKEKWLIQISWSQWSHHVVTFTHPHSTLFKLMGEAYKITYTVFWMPLSLPEAHIMGLARSALTLVHLWKRKICIKFCWFQKHHIPNWNLLCGRKNCYNWNTAVLWTFFWGHARNFGQCKLHTKNCKSSFLEVR